jgi:hypothetical protein
VSYFEDAVPKGTRVRIPKGTKIWGTFKGGRKVAGRTYVVTVDWSSPKNHVGPTGNEKPELTWAGAGGYWHRCHVEDVEILPDQGEPGQ